MAADRAAPREGAAEREQHEVGGFSCRKEWSWSSLKGRKEPGLVGVPWPADVFLLPEARLLSVQYQVEREGRALSWFYTERTTAPGTGALPFRPPRRPRRRYITAPGPTFANVAEPPRRAHRRCPVEHRAEAAGATQKG